MSCSGSSAVEEDGSRSDEEDAIGRREGGVVQPAHVRARAGMGNSLSL